MIYAGDRREIAISVTSEGEPVSPDTVNRIQFIFGDGDFIYCFPGNNVTYDEENEKYIVLLEDRDTFKLKYNFSVQARVHFSDGMIFASSAETLDLGNVYGKEKIK